MNLSRNARLILEKRYLKKDSLGQVSETPEDMFRRVAAVVASAEDNYQPGQVNDWENRFYQLMTRLEFLPNSPTLLNAGRPLGLLSSCFVLPIVDSLPDIYRVLAEAALIHKYGGGTAFSFANLRPAGDPVGELCGVAGGPVALIDVFSTAINYVRQAGVRCGCNSACLPVNHPDILAFIDAKSDGTSVANFANSILITDEFMEKAKNNEEYDLINPRTGAITDRLNAKEVLLRMAYNAWKTGDPGFTFIDRINEDNTTPNIGNFETTDPCGGQLLFPYESAPLGTINLSLMVTEKDGKCAIDYPHLAEVVHTAVRFLDDVIDVNRYPIKAVEEASLLTRKIGLGVMGFAEMLIKIGIRYNSEQAVTVANELMRFIREEAYSTSMVLATERGVFPAFEGSAFQRQGMKMRNASCLTMTNTGTTSIIAGTTCGIHPIFSFAMVRNILDGSRLLDIDRHFKETARAQGFFSRRLVTKLLNGTSLQDCNEIPEDIRSVFITVSDIAPECCIRIQAAFQNNIDNAISQTVNFPKDATVEDISKLLLKAHELRLKGLSVYRDSSRSNQVLCMGGDCLDLVEDHFKRET
jgi:ribonucleoside-diphosphate reductase alpha chain